MKISESIELSKLEDYGFVRMEEWEEDFQEGYKFEIGSSRRGQTYYFVVLPHDRILSLFASKPDGDGGKTPMTQKAFDLLLRLKNDLIL